jgi:Tfp pilus assembly protein PilE
MEQNGMSSRSQKSKFFKLISNQSGVTLVEMVIAGAMMAVIAVVVMKVNEQSSTSTAKQEIKSDLTTIVNEINSILSDPKKCYATFNADDAVNANGYITILDIASALEKDATSGDVITEPKPDYPKKTANKYAIDSQTGGAAGYGVSKIRIQTLQLKTDGTENALVVTFKNKKSVKNSTSMSGDTITRKVNLFVEWDTSGSDPVVENCRSLLSSTTLIWSRGGGTDIFYSGGNVGINTTSPSEALEVDGKVFVEEEIQAKSFMYASDARLKKNTHTINSPVEKLLALRGVSFDWKKSDQADYGFIAQEVKQTLPELVKYNRGKKILTVDYVKIVPFLLEGIKRQQEDIEELERKLNQIEETR